MLPSWLLVGSSWQEAGLSQLQGRHFLLLPLGLLGRVPIEKNGSRVGLLCFQPGSPSSVQRRKLTLTVPAYWQTCFLGQWLSDLQGNRPSERRTLTNNTACVSQSAIGFESSAPWGQGDCPKDMSRYPAQANVASDSLIIGHDQGFLGTLAVL